jgi:hypothetical protein
MQSIEGLSAGGYTIVRRDDGSVARRDDAMGGKVAALGKMPSRWRPRPRLLLFGRSWSSYRVCGVTGLGVAAGLATVLAAHSELSHAANVALLVTGIGTFLALALATKAIVGQEALIYYHHEVAILTGRPRSCPHSAGRCARIST